MFEQRRIHDGHHQNTDQTHRCWSIDRFRLFFESRARVTKGVHVEPRKAYGETHKHESMRQGDGQHHAVRAFLSCISSTLQEKQYQVTSQHSSRGPARHTTCRFNLPPHTHTETTTWVHVSIFPKSKQRCQHAEAGKAYLTVGTGGASTGARVGITGSAVSATGSAVTGAGVSGTTGVACWRNKNIDGRITVSTRVQETSISVEAQYLTSSSIGHRVESTVGSLAEACFSVDFSS